MSCPTNFCKEVNFLLKTLSNNLKKLWMLLLLFPCPGTIAVHSCWQSCCAPPLSGCVAVASSRLSTAPVLSCSRDPAPSPSGSDRGMRLSPSAASRTARKQTWQSATLRPTAGQALRRPPAATKRVFFVEPLVSSPSSPAPPQNGPGTVFLPCEEFFAHPGPAAPSQTQYPSLQ